MRWLGFAPKSESLVDAEMCQASTRPYMVKLEDYEFFREISISRLVVFIFAAIFFFPFFATDFFK